MMVKDKGDLVGCWRRNVHSRHNNTYQKHPNFGSYWKNTKAIQFRIVGREIEGHDLKRFGLEIGRLPFFVMHLCAYIGASKLRRLLTSQIISAPCERTSAPT